MHRCIRNAKSIRRKVNDDEALRSPSSERLAGRASFAGCDRQQHNQHNLGRARIKRHKLTKRIIVLYWQQDTAENENR